MKEASIFSEAVKCPYCWNTAPMRELNRTVVRTETRISADDSSPDMTRSLNWQVLECPACGNHTLREGWFNDMFEEDGISYRIIFPLPCKKEFPLPQKIKSAYDAAQTVKHVDPNAFAVLLGRLLDQVCDDKGAIGQDLFAKIKDLAKKDIVPATVSKLALGLKDFRNIGAHANLGELSSEETPIIESILDLILDYVYTSPMLIEKIGIQIEELRSRK